MPGAPEVLIVDDDESMRLLLARLLEDGGYRVACAQGGAEAIDALRFAAPPDLVVLDLLMPAVSGWDVLHFMDEQPRLATVPVVVLTSYEEGGEAPASRPVLHKPVEAELLRALVGEILRQGRGGLGSEESPGDLLPRPWRRRVRPWLV